MVKYVGLLQLVLVRYGGTTTTTLLSFSLCLWMQDEISHKKIVCGSGGGLDEYFVGCSFICGLFTLYL